MEAETYSLKNSSAEERTVADVSGMSRASKYNKWEYLLSALAIMSLLLACILISPKKYFWNDELYSYYFTSDPSFFSMLAAFHDKINNTPFLYFLLGWLWDKVFGSSELSLRLFSSLGMCLALLVTWFTLRRTYPFAAVAIGVLAVFCTSEIILLQNAEARMYGLFLALCALGLNCYARINNHQHVSTQLLVLNGLVHTCIVHTHLFGGFYSGAILIAFILSDCYFKRFRPRVYGSIILAWLTILLYIPSFLIQADAGKPRTWIPIPALTDLFDMLNILSPAFFLPGLLVVLLLLASLYLYQKEDQLAGKNDTSRPKEQSEVPLLIFGVLFILLPVAIWIFSRTIKPVFYDRYMISSALGWVIFLVFLSSRIIVIPSSNWSAGSITKLAMLFSKILFVVLLASLLYYPIHSARKNPKQTPRDVFATDGHDDLPIVIVSSHIFLQTQQYAREPEKYFFILDWEAVLDENSGLFSPQEYKHLDALRRNYPEHFQNNILTSEEFLSRYDRFLVADYPDYTAKCPAAPRGMATARGWVELHCPQWVEMRLLNDTNYKVTYLNDTYWFSMLLVEKQ